LTLFLFYTSKDCPKNNVNQSEFLVQYRVIMMRMDYYDHYYNHNYHNDCSDMCQPLHLLVISMLDLLHPIVILWRD